MTGFTQIPNDILDSMADLTPAEFKALMAVYRLIIGYEEYRSRGRRRISYGKLERMTGLSYQGIVNVMDTLAEKGYVTKGKTRGRNEWAVNSVDNSMPKTVNSVDYTDDQTVNSVDYQQSTQLIETVNSVDRDSQLSRPHINKTNKQNRKKEKKFKKSDSPFPFKPVPETVQRQKLARGEATSVEERISAIAEVCGLDLDLPPVRSKVETAAAQLRKYDADYIRHRYSFNTQPNGSWHWARDFWKGQKGQMPTLKDVIETIALTVQAQATGPPGTERTITPIEQAAAEYARQKQQWLDALGVDDDE